MRIGILGTGVVGQTLGTKLAQLGHDVRMGSRKAGGWKDIVDLGDITGARGQEMILPIWLRLFMTLNTPNLNFHIAR